MSNRQRADHRRATPVHLASIDAYLDTLNEEKREILQRLRKAIKAIRPDAEECISYGIPAFRWKGAVIAGFASTNKGYSYFPFSGSTLGTLEESLCGFKKTKSSLHFTAEKPLKTALIRMLVKTRIAEIEFRRNQR